MKNEKNGKRTEQKPKAASCESCVFYDVIDETGTLGCTADIDEDDAYRERADAMYVCRFYRFYDEYLSVRKQN